MLQRALSLEDEEAWREIHKRYVKFIYYVLSSMGVEASDLDDLTQLVFFRLINKLRLYNKERGLFRTWLKQVVKNTVLNYFEKRQSMSRVSKAYQRQYELELTASDAIENWIESEWKGYMLNLALNRLDTRCKGYGVEVLRMHLAGSTINEIKEHTGLLKNTLYTLKKRYKKHLIREVRVIKAELEGI